MSDRDTDVSPPPTPPPEKPATIPPEAPKPATVTEWAAVEGALGAVHRIMSSVAEEVRGLRKDVKTVIMMQKTFFDQLNVVAPAVDRADRRTEELETKVKALEIEVRKTILPPGANGSGYPPEPPEDG